MDMMKSLGFVNVEYLGGTLVSTSAFTVGGLFRAHKARPS